MSSNKKVIITGGSGFLGSHLSQRLLEREYRVVSLDIAPPSNSDVSFVKANLLKEIPDDSRLEDPFAVINLAGKSIFGRWDEEFKQLVYDTRVEGTKNLVQSFGDDRFRPEVFVSASAAGYYGDRGDAVLTTESEPGSGFLADVSKDWEQAAREAEAAHDIPTTIVRNGHILGSGGLLEVLLPYYRWGLGGPLGAGRQWFPWIHLEDICVLYIVAMEARGAATLNAAAPDQVRNKEFSATLADVLSRPHMFRIPEWALRILYGEFGEEMLYSQRIESSVPEGIDFSFKYPQLTAALESIVASQ